MLRFLLISILTYSCIAAAVPEFWIDCDSPSYNCGVFDFEFVRFDETGCEEGRTRVLCRSPQKHTKKLETLASEINIMTYNVYEITLKRLRGQMERTCRLAVTLATDYPHVEVIVFQEMFYGGCWKYDGASARDLLRQYGFQYFTKNVGQAPDWPTPEPEDPINAGVFIASKHPIVEEKALLFKANDYQTQDVGVMYAKIIKYATGKNRTYHVFGSHLRCCHGQAYETLRILQAIEWNTFIKGMAIPINEPVILAADFNMDYCHDPEHVMNMLEILRVKVPPVVSDQYPTWFTSENDILVLQGDKPVDFECIDYVLLRSDYLQPIHAVQTYVKPHSKQPMRVCWEAAPNATSYYGYVWPDTEECARTEEISDLSDHYAVVGTFLFPDC